MVYALSSVVLGQLDLLNIMLYHQTGRYTFSSTDDCIATPCLSCPVALSMSSTEGSGVIAFHVICRYLLHACDFPSVQKMKKSRVRALHCLPFPFPDKYPRACSHRVDNAVILQHRVTAAVKRMAW